MSKTVLLDLLSSAKYPELSAALEDAIYPSSQVIPVPTAKLKPALDHISKNKDRFLHDFRTLLKQPSVSAQRLGIEDCAKIVKKQMDMAGLNAKILPVKNGNPVVYGEARSKSSSKTLLIYGHYDVQPVEPLKKWVA